MLLKSHQVFDTVADFNPMTGAFETFSRNREPQRASQQFCGSFDFVDGMRVLLFRLAGVLYLQMDDERHAFNDLVIEVRLVNGERFLRVLSRGETAVELSYSLPLLDPPLSDDLTPFVEEEDFDFGLFLTNVSRDRSRQGRLYLGC